MRRRPTQGLSLIALVVGALLVGAAGLAAVKVGVPYGDARTIAHISQTVLAESKSEGTTTNYEVGKKIFDRANIQSIPLDFENIRVKTVNSGEFSVHIDMVTKIQIWKQGTLIIDLPVDAQTK